VASTKAAADDRSALATLAEAMQDATGESVNLALVDQGYIGERPTQAAAAHGIALEVVRLSEARRGFMLLPRRWVIERSLGRMARFRRLTRDYGRLPTPPQASTSSPSPSFYSGAPQPTHINPDGSGGGHRL
jgi:transposase